MTTSNAFISKEERRVEMVEQVGCQQDILATERNILQYRKDSTVTPNFNTTPTYDSMPNPTAEHWIRQFFPEQRSQLALLMHSAARGRGNMSATATLSCFRRKIMRKPELRHVLSAIQTDQEGALRYAEAVIAEERLPVEERERLRRERSKPFAQAHMATKLPTQKQLAYLRRLGYRGPAPEDRLAASQLIEKLTGGGHEA